MEDVKAFDKADYGLLPVAVERGARSSSSTSTPTRRRCCEQLGDLPARLAGYRLDEWGSPASTSYEIAAN